MQPVQNFDTEKYYPLDLLCFFVKALLNVTRCSKKISNLATKPPSYSMQLNPNWCGFIVRVAAAWNQCEEKVRGKNLKWEITKIAPSQYSVFI